MGSWVEDNEKQQDAFGQSMFQSRASKEMLKISDTNRFIASDKQAILLNLSQMMTAILYRKCRTDEGRTLFKNISGGNIQDVQTAQLTRDGMSRGDFKDIEMAGAQRKKSWNPFSRKTASTADSQVTDDETEGAY